MKLNAYILAAIKQVALCAVSEAAIRGGDNSTKIRALDDVCQAAFDRQHVVTVEDEDEDGNPVLAEYLEWPEGGWEASLEDARRVLWCVASEDVLAEQARIQEVIARSAASREYHSARAAAAPTGGETLPAFLQGEVLGFDY